MVQQLQRSISATLCDATEGGVPARELLLLLLLVLLGVPTERELGRLVGALPSINDPVKVLETRVPLTESLRPSVNLTFDSAMMDILEVSASD